MSVMSGLLVVAGFMMLGGFAVVIGRALMMLGGLLVMMGSFLRHDVFLSRKGFQSIAWNLSSILAQVRLQTHCEEVNCW